MVHLNHPISYADFPFLKPSSYGGSSIYGTHLFAIDLSPRPNAGYTFDPTSAVTAQSGRGGNFALGYTGGLE